MEDKEASDGLKVPELLLLCFEDLSPAQLTIVALVCKTWLTVAQDVLWRTVMIPFSLLMERLTPGQIISLPLKPVVRPVSTLPLDSIIFLVSRSDPS